ncbi:MAG: hypothetical protein JWM48_2572 [Mycobacterium sp.]|nr:hypothetical protein [Mycobacterium sp.]
MQPENLLAAPLYRFADWPNSSVPNWRSGVYAVWHGSRFIYVGMSGRGMAADAHLDPAAAAATKPKGLRDRLNSHSSGRRSGDQFCVYVCDRLVLPTLTRAQIDDIAAGNLLLDSLTRNFIRSELSYRFLVLSDGRAAAALEDRVRREGLAGGLPLLNPGTRRVRAGGGSLPSGASDR